MNKLAGRGSDVLIDHYHREKCDINNDNAGTRLSSPARFSACDHGSVSKTWTRSEDSFINVKSRDRIITGRGTFRLMLQIGVLYGLSIVFLLLFHMHVSGLHVDADEGRHAYVYAVMCWLAASVFMFLKRFVLLGLVPLILRPFPVKKIHLMRMREKLTVCLQFLFAILVIGMMMALDIFFVLTYWSSEEIPVPV